MKALWSFFQRWFKSDRSSRFTWHDPGGNNPFGVRFLDIRALTQTMVSTTANPEIAKSFVNLRASDGTDLVPAELDPVSVEACDLRLPHNGVALEGIVFKANAMEVKWDIYAYDSKFLFARSWTGELVFQANFEVSDSEISIGRVAAAPEYGDKSSQYVYFLLVSHAMGLVVPHPISDSTLQDPEQIALLSFSEFGNRACFATFEDVTQIPIPIPAD